MSREEAMEELLQVVRGSRNPGKILSWLLVLFVKFTMTGKELKCVFADKIK